MSARIGSMEKLALLSKQLSEAETVRKAAENGLSDSITAYVCQMKLSASQLNASTLECVKEVNLATDELKVLTDTTWAEIDCLSAETNFWESAWELKNTLDNTKEVWLKTIAQHNAIVTVHKQILQNRTRSLATEKLALHTKTALEVIESLRKEFIQQELDSIAGEVDRLYSELHPGEKIGGVKLSLAKEHQRSLHLTANFYTQSNITPQSLYSESHLDTLGFVVFFALAKSIKLTIPLLFWTT